MKIQSTAHAPALARYPAPVHAWARSLTAATTLLSVACGPGVATDTAADTATDTEADTDESSATAEGPMVDLPAAVCTSPDPSLADGLKPEIIEARLAAPDLMILRFSEPLACTDEVQPKQFRFGAYVHALSGGPTPLGGYRHQEVITDQGLASHVVSIEHQGPEMPELLHLRIDPPFDRNPCEEPSTIPVFPDMITDAELVLDYTDSFGASIVDRGGEPAPPLDPAWVDIAPEMGLDGTRMHTLTVHCDL